MADAGNYRPGLIERARDLIAGVNTPTAHDKASVAGKLQNRGAYLRYREAMVEQGNDPLTYAEWAKAQ